MNLTPPPPKAVIRAVEEEQFLRGLAQVSSFTSPRCGYGTQKTTKIAVHKSMRTGYRWSYEHLWNILFSPLPCLQPISLALHLILGQVDSIVQGGGKFRGGIFPRGKFRISIWCGIFPSFFEGRCGIFPVRNFVHVSHRTTVCLVLRRALPFVLFPLFCSCCQPTGKGGQEVE